MSDLNKREIIAELKALRDNIQNFEAAQQNLQSCEAKLKEAEEISTSTYYNKYPTDNYQTEHKKYIFENKKRKETKKRVFFTVTIAILVAMIALWLCMSGIFTKNTYLYTPEILKEYSGTYEADHIPALDVHLSIISCEENGTFQGMFEFSGYENLLNSDIHGKFSVTGQIQTKSREGHVNATLSFNEWLEKAAGRARMLESEFKEIPIKIGKELAGQKIAVKFRGEYFTTKVNSKGKGVLKISKKLARELKLKKGKKYKAHVVYKDMIIYKKQPDNVKIDGKTYTVKTNKKGTAIFKITKKMVKKLKPGKKYPYYVEFGENIAKRNLVIKK